MKELCRVLSVVLCTVSCALPLSAGDSLTAEDVLAKHLASIGTPEARAGVKSRVVQGSANFKIIVGGGGEILGTTGMVSEGRKQRFVLKFQQNYRGENFLYNGDKVSIGFSNADQTRSGFASLVYAQDAILREGLFGGVLSTGWALLDVPGRKAKLTYDGLKKVDGRELHRLTYQPHKGTDLKIQLFFDPETFHHVMTVYLLEVGNNVGKTILDSPNLKADRTTLEERFDGFTTVEGITLPNHWTFQYTRELPSGTTAIFNWDLKEDNIQQNVTLDPRNFEMK
jgi:hypothetical protein